MSALVKRLLDLRNPISPELILGMTVATAAAALIGAYVLVLLVGP
jgi:hypothetical protein